jgi:hypothetical protein
MVQTIVYTFSLMISLSRFDLIGEFGIGLYNNGMETSLPGPEIKVKSCHSPAIITSINELLITMLILISIQRSPEIFNEIANFYIFRETGTGLVLIF